MQSDEIERVWNQGKVPVVVRGRTGPLRVRLPFHKDNMAWLRNERGRRPLWHADQRYWELPAAWFSDFVERAIGRYSSLYVVQPFREQEKCSPACQKAKRHECQCSCMGRYHGAGIDGSWFEVSETFSTRWHEETVACRLMIKKIAG